MHRTILLFLLLILVSHAFAQTDSTHPRLAVTISAGMAVNDRLTWNSVPVRPGYAVGLGLVYGPMKVADLARLYLSAEAGYSQTRSDDFSFTIGRDSERDSYTRWRRMPAMAWVKLTTAAAFSPYIRAGLGTMNVRFDERHASAPQFDTALNYWAFAWGAGGGMEWTISNDMHIAFFAEIIAGEGTHRDEYGPGILERSCVVPIGLRGTYTL